MCKYLCIPFHDGIMTDEEERKREKMTRFDFPTLSKVSRTFLVVLYLDSEVLISL